MTSDQMINKVGGNIQEKAALIWNVANTLVGLYKPHEYGLVILPMCIIKRFHDCLLPTHEKVLETYEKIKTLEVKDGFLSKASGYQFYNTSKFTFETLVADPDNIADNFEDYINGFSDNVKDILHRMKFEDQIKTMKEGKVLYQVISDFNSAKADMNPEKISAIDMGYIFENLVQRFSESYDEEAGAHFTSRDIIYTMCDLLVSGDKNAFSSDGINKTVYDMTMGTSQMLTCMEERLRQFDKAAVVTSFGQEFNPFTFGIAKADMLIRGGDPDNMQFGDTLNDDKFSGYTFDYIISNPPFGIDWKKEASDIEKESKLGARGRFGVGLPPKSDGQLLFMLNGVAKLKETGRMAIIQNGSSLFSGDAGSGQSEIRRYLIENDWLDAIVQLPNDSFYNTGIATYIWIVTKNKDEKRLGRVQLIDASNCYESRRKNIGNKRVDLTTDCRNLILRAYDEYSDKDYEEKTENGNSIICKSKVLDSVDLGYNKITVESPLLDENGETVKDKKGKTQSDSNKRDYENVPLDEDIDKYFEREVLPYNKASWIDKSKTKVGYEIPFTRTFYVYKQLEKADEIASRIEWHEKSLMEKLRKLFGEE
ncbi:class I SAM-dependent DNA methyltransferase [Treponema succinifaciens]|uniref:type I restriction-modification system subunit M n=1 Tax=Treponema succinifaciens TaxID=167 RepID=UPI0023F0618F|nr:class I SAM-dependent DNA methyltransferase [Treponema succinifaciens]